MNKDPFSLNTLGHDMVAQVLFVTIPSDVDRDAYIQTFYQTAVLAVVGDGGEFFTKVNVPNHLISSIQFPYSKSEKGSAVLVVTPEKYPTAKFILAVLPYNNTLDGVIDENCIYQREVSGENFIEILGDANNAFFQINVNSQNAENGSVVIRLKTPQNSVLIEANSDGELSFTSTNSITQYAKNTIRQVVLLNEKVVTDVYFNQKEVSAKKLDDKGNTIASFSITEKDAIVKIKDISVVIGDSVTIGKNNGKTEKAVLGETQLKILKDLCDALSKIKTDPATGVILPDSVTQFQKIKGSLETTLARFTLLN